jgi:UDP-GlcNAc:undecaprenyl-phosphate GlcNAc-1-phosphate transferase
VTVIRLIEKRSIFEGGKDHSSHRLALLGLKRFGAVMIIYLVCIALGMAALGVRNAGWATATALFLIVFLAMLGFGIRLAFIGTKRFGYKKT